ncbi:MAG: hypothetical protein E7641_00515 [Ruminococcaceae bacterium]|nr:hypothetical protein [Oscillospiraceae bacterium]
MSSNEKKEYFRGATLFAASNSAEGFKSYYEQIFKREELTRFYIIKGGPGTGKSSFMRAVARAFSEKGYSVEYYNCSSDPDSVDAIVIEDRIAMVDGTSPHSCDVQIAGARDEIINLGEFWNSEALASEIERIEQLTALKKDTYDKGYKYLSACGRLLDINLSLILPALREDKMLGVISRILQSIPKGDGYRVIPAVTDSVGMKGRVKFDTLEKCAEKLYSVVDAYSTAHLFIAAVITEAKRKDIPVRISYDPIDPSRADGVFLIGYGIAFTVCEGDEAESCLGVRINMKRFIDRERLEPVKREYRANMRLYEALLTSACDAFSEAGEYHFELEKIYSSAMDYKAKESFQRSFTEKLLNSFK